MPNILIVSNRLPVSVKRNEDGQLEMHPSSGGLATALSSYTTRRGSLWIGWPGIAADELTAQEKRWISKELKKLHCSPIFLSQRQLDGFYNGYSNTVLWPVLHHMAAEFGDTNALYRTYTEVNKRFADAVFSISSARTKIWVHDYQLMLLPQLLRKRLPRNQIGFFLHIPFPEATEFQRIPEARKLLVGVLGSSLVGFHTNDYVTKFLASCKASNIGTVVDTEVLLENRGIRIAEFPIGIDYTKFSQASSSKIVKKKVRELNRQVRGAKIVLTVDRLEPSKGFIERLQAYKELLKYSPELHGKVVMIMLAVPSRTEIPVYQQLRTEVEALVYSINTMFGTKRWEPIRYMFTSLPFEDIAALYAAADVAFVAPLRDGMNLVAKEYVASQNRGKGVLILSETAGAAHELHDALLVDPHKMRSLVAALSTSLTMPRRELKTRLKRMQHHLSTHTVQRWAQSFMDTLNEPRSIKPPTIKLLTPHTKTQIYKTFQAAQKRLIVLDYDGTLVPFFGAPENARPSPQLIQLLENLTKLPATDVVLSSGRAAATLEAWFGSLHISLVAEHGAATKVAGGTWAHDKTTTLEWKEFMRPIMETYCRNAPGTFVEEKDYSLVWHFREALPYHAQKNLLQLRQILKPHLQPNKLRMTLGNKILEIRPAHINKGSALSKWLERGYDFILVIGDDKTDEDMFLAAPAGAYTIKVRQGRTKARYRLSSTDTVLRLLQKFIS